MSTLAPLVASTLGDRVSEMVAQPSVRIALALLAGCSLMLAARRSAVRSRAGDRPESR